MSSTSEQSQQAQAVEFEDFATHGAVDRLNKAEIFDADFIDFMKWLRQDVKSRYTLEDFRRIERHDILVLFLGYPALFAAYLALHTYAPQHALLWGVPMFMAAIWLCLRGEGIHMRAHNPVNFTGAPVVDKMIDYLGLAASGISQTLFRRRHLAAHYNDVGSVSKCYSNVWLTYDKVPLLNYMRPWVLVKFLLDDEFLAREKIDRRMLLIETVVFYAYLALLVSEIVFFNSYFLLAFHILPGLWVAGAQIIGATFVHSGFDAENSFDSNGLFDAKTATGLMKVPLVWFGLFNCKFFENHGIHHAWPQMPLKIINDDYQRYHKHILSNYKRVRYNSVLSAHVHKELLDRMPPPRWYDYIVAFFVSLFCHVAMVVTAFGLPVPPVLLELAMVDWRIFFMSTREERMRAKVAHLTRCRTEEIYHAIPEPNTYLKFYYWWLQRMKSQLAEIDARRAATSA